MLKELFIEQKRSLDYFWDHIDLQDAEVFFKLCCGCKGLIVLTGVGKSGIVAEKIATTLISTGTRALTLSPTNFLHGDLGILGKDDLLIMLSKSGESEELLNLVPFVKRRQTKLLALVSKKDSRLAKVADYAMNLPLDKELCPFDLAPTTSTVLQLIFGEILAVALMKAKNFSLDDYAHNHPSGSIGKKMTLTVGDLMLKEEMLPICELEERLGDVLVELTNKKCGCLLVVDKNKHFVGIFTDGDLRRALQSFGSDVLEERVKTLMTPSPLAVERDELAWNAMKIMQKDPKKWVMMLPVLEKKQVVGLLRMHDIVHSGL
jgi:arabinose-5-phosphate isomerase